MTDSLTAIPAPIRALLVCPKCHGSLTDSAKGVSLDCMNCKLRFPVRDGIPVMLLDEAAAILP